MAEPRPFRPRVFLFRTLAAIFMAEIVLILVAMLDCGRPKETAFAERCPHLGQRAQELFTLATSTVLSLLIDPSNSHD